MWWCDLWIYTFRVIHSVCTAEEEEDREFLLYTRTARVEGLWETKIIYELCERSIYIIHIIDPLKILLLLLLSFAIVFDRCCKFFVIGIYYYTYLAVYAYRYCGFVVPFVAASWKTCAASPHYYDPRRRRRLERKRKKINKIMIKEI